ncbi:hypothetical protein [Paenibacillus sp. FSL M7-0896]|uniref:BC1872 family protein n=1 Tax=Paenibacillus sp. FSL M7-0896 TaxID=2921610 RepID=UPI0030D7F488
MTLTREEILNEPPGIQLDQWVSKYVMGYETRRYYRADDPQSFDEFYIVDNKKYENVYYTSEWQPSKYIDVAWKVEERIKELANGAPMYTGYYMTELQLIVGNKGFDMVHATPEQRCKAALLAVLGL